MAEAASARVRPPDEATGRDEDSEVHTPRVGGATGDSVCMLLLAPAVVVVVITEVLVACVVAERVGAVRVGGVFVGARGGRSVFVLRWSRRVY